MKGNSTKENAISAKKIFFQCTTRPQSFPSTVLNAGGVIIGILKNTLNHLISIVHSSNNSSNYATKPHTSASQIWLAQWKIPTSAITPDT
jgi:hypothetical protein